jgi:hypothetical protein
MACQLMNLDPNTISAGAAAIAVIISLFTFIAQSRTQVRHIKAQVSSELTARLNDSNVTEIGHPELYDFFQTPFIEQTAENHTSVTLTDIRLALLEEAFTQYHKYKLLDDDDWRPWRAILGRWIKRPFFDGYWKMASQYFRASFVEEVDQIRRDLTQPKA